MEDIGLIPTEDLTSELEKRFDALTIIGIQLKTKPGQDTYYHRYSGGHANCLGLNKILESIILKDYHEDGKLDLPGS